ncbi:glycosyltransferase family 17 protein [Canariomyces notabilis]|uniref:Glycosyltransferase family 17 protein n=1 Tax=Canariomyces notabilis TaxID=2074819 RepID=A0AAN6TCJ4_9PEZI|nr:glycosyltransferase family 17 protein [Canariomyces arenarius]
MPRRRLVRVAPVFGFFWLLYLFAGEIDVSEPATRWPATDGQADPCRLHGWKSFKPESADTPRKVYDLLMINTELDWLEIRLNSTWDAVDYYVLVEGRMTFTGLDKPLTLRDNMSKFEQYQSKIIYREIEYPPDFDPHYTWDIEDHQRNSMFTQVFPRLTGSQAPNLGDVIVVSDVDEIPRPSTLAVLRECQFPRRLTLRSRFYYYSFQYLHRGVEWAHPQATYYQGLRETLLPNDLRLGIGGIWPFKEWEKADFWNASWHCSSCFETIGELLTKMGSFSHISMNAEQYRDRERIADRVRNGKDLWDREGEVYDRIENNLDVPSFLLQNKDRFRYMLNRDGPTAGFTDYDG